MPTVTPPERAPTVYQPISGEKDNKTPENVTAANTNIKITNALNLSAKMPPKGRKSVAIMIKMAVLIPASTGSKPKFPTKKLGRNMVNATNATNDEKEKKKEHA